MSSDARVKALEDAISQVLLAVSKGEATLPDRLLGNLKSLNLEGVTRVPTLNTSKVKPRRSNSDSKAMRAGVGVVAGPGVGSKPNTPRRVVHLYEAGVLKMGERRRDEVTPHEMEELQKCTFQPQLTAASKRMERDRDATPFWERMGGVVATSQLNARLDQLNKKSEKLSLEGCTYRPTIHSRRKKRGGSPPRLSNAVFDRLSYIDPEQAHNAAVKIQAVARGRITRARMESAIDRLYSDAEVRRQKRAVRLEELYDFPFQPELNKSFDTDSRGRSTPRRSVSPATSSVRGSSLPRSSPARHTPEKRPSPDPRPILRSGSCGSARKASYHDPARVVTIGTPTKEEGTPREAGTPCSPPQMDPDEEHEVTHKLEEINKVQQRRAVDAKKAAEAKRIEERKAAEAKRADERRRAAEEKKAVEAKKAEERKAVEVKRAEERKAAAEEKKAAIERQAAERRKKVEERKAQDAARAEELKREREAKEARVAEEKKLKAEEAKNKAEAAKQAEAEKAKAAADAKAKKEETRLAAEAKKAEDARLAEEQKQANLAADARKEEESRLAEEARLEQANQAGEQARLDEEARLAEEARVAEEVHWKEAEAQRLKEQEEAQQQQQFEEEKEQEEAKKRAEEAKKAEEDARLAEQLEEERKAEEDRKAEEERQAEEARKAEEERQEAEEAKKAAEAEEARKVEEERKAEEDRKAERAEEERQAEEARKAEEEHKAEQTRQAKEEEEKREKAKAEEAKKLAAENKRKKELEDLELARVAMEEERKKAEKERKERLVEEEKRERERRAALKAKQEEEAKAEKAEREKQEVAAKQALEDDDDEILKLFREAVESDDAKPEASPDPNSVVEVASNQKQLSSSPLQMFAAISTETHATQQVILDHCTKHQVHYRTIFRSEAQWTAFKGLWTDMPAAVSEKEYCKLWEAALGVPEEASPKSRQSFFGRLLGRSTPTNSTDGSEVGSPTGPGSPSKKPMGGGRKKPSIQRAAATPVMTTTPPPQEEQKVEDVPQAEAHASRSENTLLTPGRTRRRSQSPSKLIPRHILVERIKKIYIDTEKKSERSVELIIEEYKDSESALYDMLCRRHKLTFSEETEAQ